MSRISIGVGLLVAAAAALGVLNHVWSVFPLGAVAILLVGYGTYEEWIKPHFRVEHRLKDWLIRRAWSVRMQRAEGLTFRLEITSGSSGKRVSVTRDRKSIDDTIAFTSAVEIDGNWITDLTSLTSAERRALRAEIIIYLTARGVGWEFFPDPAIGAEMWPPVLAVTTRVAQDHTLSQQSVDEAAHRIETAALAVRQIIQKAL